MTTVLEKIFFTVIMPGKEYIFKDLFNYWLNISGSLFILVGVMSYFQLTETRTSSQLKLNLGKKICQVAEVRFCTLGSTTKNGPIENWYTLPLEGIQSTNEENKEGYERCSKQFLNVAEQFDDKMKLVRKIEPDKKSLEEQFKKCNEELASLKDSV